MIVVGGMIGVGKSSVAGLIAKDMGTEVFYEQVDDNEILPLYYTASPEEQEAKRYPFLLQLEFLNSRFSDIKNALYHRHNVIDRSIYEDWYFAKINHLNGNISDTEFKIYEKLLTNMLEELDGLPKKAPDLMIYLHASFETILYRIGLRGREFEQDNDLVAYYYQLWEGYNDWIDNHYSASQVLKINMDELDIVNNEEDAQRLLDQVKGYIKNHLSVN